MTLGEILLLWANHETLLAQYEQTISTCKQALKDLYITIGSAKIQEAPAPSGKIPTLDGAAAHIIEEKDKYREILTVTSDQLYTTLFFSQLVSRALSPARPFERDLLSMRLKTKDSWKTIAAAFDVSPRSAQRICKKLTDMAAAELKSQDLI